MVELLEWLAFGGALFSVWLYGKSRLYGPYAGVSVAILFILYGVVAEIYAAALSNVIFLGLHLRNLFSARKEDIGIMKEKVIVAFKSLTFEAHRIASQSGWWNDMPAEAGPERGWYIATKLCLIHSEVSEAMEGHRKGKMDDHLPHRSSLEVELADTVIRIADMAGALGLDIAGAIAEKMEYNSTRPDHRLENREKADGKKY